MKIYKETGKFIIAFCPKHNDKNNANFVINKCEYNGKPKGFAYCYACGYHTEYSSEFVDSMSKKKTQRFREQVPIDWHNLVISYLNSPDWETKSCNLADDWKINCNTLVSYYTGWTGEAWSIPMRKVDEQFCGIQLRYPDNSKCCIEGSQLGLFLPYILLDRPIIITEGFSDAAIATDLGFFGLGRPSAQAGNTMVKDFLILNNITDVTIVADNDQSGTGKKSAEKLSDLLEQKNITTRTIMPGGVKDLREFYSCNNREKTIKFLKG